MACPLGGVEVPYTEGHRQIRRLESEAAFEFVGKSIGKELLKLRNRIASQKRIDFSALHGPVVVDRKPKEAGAKLKCELVVALRDSDERRAIRSTAGSLPEQAF